jgi:hypothetical protein
MKDSSIADSRRPDALGTDDDAVFSFINSLRLSVRARVATEQQRGLSLSEIVIQVREMVRVANEDAARPQPLPSRVFRAVSRQALAWCVEAYQPLVFMAGNGFPRGPNTSEPLPLRPAQSRPTATPRRSPALSPNNRGTP